MRQTRDQLASARFQERAKQYLKELRSQAMIEYRQAP
jgi:hypothetical protein